MPDETDDLTLQILRETRTEAAEFRAEMRAFRNVTGTRFAGIEDRLDTVEEVMTGMGGVIFQIDARLMGRDERLEALELSTRP